MQQLWSNFTLGEEESLGVHLLDQGEGELGEKDNLCIFCKFNNMLDKIRVLEGMPWSFDNHLVLLKDFDGSVQASKGKRMFVKIGVFNPSNGRTNAVQAWLRAPVGRGSKNITGQKAGVEKPQGEKTDGVSPECGPESLEQSY
ncbi:unnamed protein product [Ilex paraguariensis]|uniref:DUF4283 domain-containing protein n=1 Tax=Ilex paraguariensis TaxID=185542 RepID=A0ABC8TIM8_9AQUA